jgi:hypothetical protein
MLGRCRREVGPELKSLRDEAVCGLGCKPSSVPLPWQQSQMLLLHAREWTSTACMSSLEGVNTSGTAPTASRKTPTISDPNMRKMRSALRFACFIPLACIWVEKSASARFHLLRCGESWGMAGVKRWC